MDAIRPAVAGPLHRIARIRVPAERLGPAFWADASGFGLDDQLRVVELQSPGSEEQLLAGVEATASLLAFGHHPE